MLHRFWKGVGDDTRMHHSTSPDGTNWSQEHPLTRPDGQPVGRTSHGPAVAFFAGMIQLVWKNATDEHMLHASSRDGVTWSDAPLRIVGLTSDRPAIVAHQNRLHRVWKGVTGDTRMFLSGNPSGKANDWSPERPIGGFTSHGPALVSGPAGKIYRIFKGADPDVRMHVSSSPDGGLWTDDVPILGLTSHGPAVAAGPNARLYRVWKGVPGDVRIFASSSPNEVTWSGEQPIIGETPNGPALTAGPGGRLYRYWRSNDGAIQSSVSTAVAGDGSVTWGPVFPIAGLTGDTPVVINI